MLWIYLVSADRTAAARSASLSYSVASTLGKKNRRRIAKKMNSLISMSNHNLRPTVIWRNPSTYIDVIRLKKLISASIIHLCDSFVQIYSIFPENRPKPPKKLTRRMLFVRSFILKYWSVKKSILQNDSCKEHIWVKNKNYKQIANLPNSYVIVDETETGFGNKIPM